MKGSIKEVIKDNKYRVTVDIGRVAGRRKQKVATVNGTRKDAEKMLAKLTLNADKLLAEAAGKPEPKAHKRAREMTIGEYLEDWHLVSSQNQDLRQRSIIYYRLLINYIKETDIISIPLVDVEPLDVQKAINQLPLRLKASTRKAACRLLRSVFNQALEWDIIKKNPFRGVKLPKVPHEERRFWTEKEAAIFLTAVKGSRHYTILYVALATGLRINELLALTWDDLDLKKGCLKVSKNLISASNGDPVTGPPKTDGSNRTVWLDTGTVEVIKAHRKSQLQQRLNAKKWLNHNLVFCRRDGGAVNYGIYRRIILAQQYLVPTIPVHALRHTHATFLLNQGVPELVIADRLGHVVGDKSKTILGMTAHYSHVTDDARKDAAKAFARALQKGFLEHAEETGKVGQNN